MFWRFLAVGCCMVVGIHGAASLWADGIHLNGLSPRAIGRGGTNIAHADNGAVLFDNPAGAVFIEGDGLFDVGGNLLLMDFRYSDPDNPSASDFGISPLPSFGLVRKTEDGRFAYGLGIYAPAGFSETWEMQGQFPNAGEQTYKSFGALAKILPGVAYQVNDQLSVGATFGLGISHVELEGPYTLQNAGLLTGLPTRIDLQATGAAPVYSLGLQYKMTEATTLGLTYQSETRLQLEGNTLADVPVLGSSRYDTHLDMAWPRTLGLGVKHQLDPTQVFSMDLVWFNWSQAFNNFDIQLSDADRLLFPDINEQLPLDWKDSVSVKLGYEKYLCPHRVLRCGYIYHRNPVPTDTMTPYIQGITEHALSAGFGFRWRSWDLDASYMFLFSPEFTTGTNSLVGTDFDNSTHQSFIHALGLSAIRRF